MKSILKHYGVVGPPERVITLVIYFAYNIFIHYLFQLKVFCLDYVFDSSICNETFVLKLIAIYSNQIRIGNRKAIGILNTPYSFSLLFIELVLFVIKVTALDDNYCSVN